MAASPASGRTTPIRLSRLLVTVSVCVLSCACGPLYRTTYGYQPPPDRVGQLCAAQCGTTRQLCRDNADARAQSEYSQCEIEAQQQYYECLNAARDRKQRRSCFLRQCNSHAWYGDCDDEYRSCYGACGGRVTPYRHCVWGCDDAGDSDAPGARQ